MKIYTLHTGSWDSIHLTGLFSTKQKAEDFILFFNIKDNPSIEEIELDKLDAIVKSGKIPYLASCTKKAKIKLQKKDLYEIFSENNVHFSFGIMYYFLLADNDEQAKEMAEKMRQRFIDTGWKRDSNEGVQIL